MNRLTRLGGLFVTAFLLSLPNAAHACATCMGDTNPKTGAAVNAAIFLMIGCIGAMLGCLGLFAYNLAKRAASPVPPHVQLTESFAQSGAAK